jgi:hypothetical protein
MILRVAHVFYPFWRRRRKPAAARPAPQVSINIQEDGSGTGDVPVPVSVSRTPDVEVKETPLTSEMLSVAVWLKSQVSPSPHVASSQALRVSLLMPAGTAKIPVKVSVVLPAPVTEVLTQPVVGSVEVGLGSPQSPSRQS